MKYKIIPEEVIKNLVEFLDEIQFEAAKSKNSPQELQKINFVNWAISQLINGMDGYSVDETDRPANKNEKWDIIDEYFMDFELPEDMSKKEIRTMMDQFEGFFKGLDKENKKSKHVEKKQKNKQSLKQFKNNLIVDNDLTPEEKFELYYHEYKKEKKKIYSIDGILKTVGLRKSSGGSDTH